jgi:SAM-dependent methyltransferase
MRVRWHDVLEVLVDPVDRSALRVSGDQLVAASGGTYPLVDGQPVLLPRGPLEIGSWSFPAISVDETRPRPGKQPLVALGKKFQRVTRRLIGGQGGGTAFLNEIRATTGDRRGRVVVVGGASVGEGSDVVVDAADLDVISFDVYPTVNTTFVGDAHRMPLADSCADGVWVQAVLEHVYRPDIVVAEIARVLAPGGLVYAETPFLQPVHEGAYDYTRFTVSGHRLLFGAFSEVRSGVLGGPGAVTNLAMRGLIGGVTRNRFLARVAYALTMPLALVDRFVAPQWRVDYASGAYFLGRLDGVGRSFDAVAIYQSSVRDSEPDPT